MGAATMTQGQRVGWPVRHAIKKVKPRAAPKEEVRVC